jgi:uncharacterized membrane protein YedE/YeeE
MANFTPVSAAIGGALIGLSVALFMLLSGRIAGISGILGESLSADTDKGWRLAFLAGLVAAPLFAILAGFEVASPQMPGSWGVIILAGLLVGFGICGIARLSPRSLTAAAIFMAAAIIVVFVTRHVLGA